MLMHVLYACSAALTFAAAVPSMRSACTKHSVPDNTVFEMFGLDFILDGNDQPWLLEVNATPSMAVEHSDPEGAHVA